MVENILAEIISPEFIQPDEVAQGPPSSTVLFIFKCTSVLFRVFLTSHYNGEQLFQSAEPLLFL